MSTIRDLQGADMSRVQKIPKSLLTEVLCFIAPALASFVRVSLWTMLEGFVTITDIVKEML